MIATTSTEEFHAAVAATIEKPLVVFFSSSGCGNCTMVAPKMATLAAELASSATFLTVSAETLDALGEEVEVERFPHFRVYKETKMLGDLTSSKVDKVDAFIRELIAPETLEEGPETKEMEKEVGMDSGRKEEEGLKKRQEREEMQVNDEQSAKKAKVEERAEKAEERAETMEEGSNGVEEVVLETPEIMIGSAEVTDTTDVPLEVAETTVLSEVTETTDVSSEVTEKKLEDAVGGDTMDSSDVAAAATA